MNIPEILAPAGNPEALLAAVRCGANAVYLGGKALNARRNAGNFTDEELVQAVQYCHARGVKVYITLNTLVNDSEMLAAVEIIERSCAIGADALILQDIGLARIAKALAPDMPLHASTQMSVHTSAGLRELQDMGFCRAVLARELSLKEIKEIASDTDMELELFIHGALCMCVSGQCYLSAILGSRSGNRGLCAQPCRLPFSAVNGTGYDLSLKDLSIIEHINALSKAGVTSFKIEGRMKRPEYVAAAVTACTQSLTKTVSDELKQQLKSVFSRSGFTEGYYTGTLGREMFGIRQKEDVTSAASVLSSLNRLYDRETPLVAVDFAFTAIMGEPISLSVSAGGKMHFVQSEILPQTAMNRPLTNETISDQLKKCGGTPFYAQKVDIELDDTLSVPISAINSLRRKALDGLLTKLEVVKPKHFNGTNFDLKTIKTIIASSYKENPTLATINAEIVKASCFTRPSVQTPLFYARFSDIKQLDFDLSGLNLLFLPLDTSLEHLKQLKEQGIPIAVEIPRGIFGSQEKIKKQLIAVYNLGIQIALAGTLDGVRLAKEIGMTVYGGFSLNIYNSFSLLSAERSGVEQTHLSIESTLTQIAKLDANIKRGIIAYGRVPLMLTRNCSIANGKSCSACNKNSIVTDRMGISFPIVCTNGCSELLNSKPIYLADRLREIKGVDFLTLYFTKESAQGCAQIIQAYQKEIPPVGEYTRGLYYRGVE